MNIYDLKNKVKYDLTNEEQHKINLILLDARRRLGRGSWEKIQYALISVMADVLNERE